MADLLDRPWCQTHDCWHWYEDECTDACSVTESNDSGSST